MNGYKLILLRVEAFHIWKTCFELYNRATVQQSLLAALADGLITKAEHDFAKNMYENN
jgi:hypothetical protein